MFVCPEACIIRDIKLTACLATVKRFLAVDARAISPNLVGKEICFYELRYPARNMYVENNMTD